MELMPVEFDIKNYKDTALLDAKGWLNEFYIRQYVQGLILKGETEVITRMNLNNIIRGCYQEDESMFGSNPVSCFTRLYYDAVTYNILKNDGLPFGINQEFAIVDLSAPDSVLKESFIRWVKDQRRKKSIAIRKKVSNSKCSDWHKYRVLPYIDLMQWHSLNGINCTHGQIGEIIFPDDNSGAVADKIRRTTKKYSEEVLCSRLTENSYFQK